MLLSALLREALEYGEGILRLAPAWVPRSFIQPGGRLRLDPRDLYALGAHRGGIDERWLASTTQADNGPGTPQDEGLSYVAHGGRRLLFRTAIELRGGDLLGPDTMSAQGGWNVLFKLFDNEAALPHHMHQDEMHARRVGQNPKPEAYYFPRQYNLREGRFPYTFMGLEPGTTHGDIRRCLERWNEGDNGILYHSRAYKLKPGTGWQIDAGILHAPGSLVTYEAQVNSDVFSMFQSSCDGRPLPWDMLVRNVPPEHHQDLDYIIGMLDWDANLDPCFARRRLCHPLPVRPGPEMADSGYRENWIVYSRPYYSAKELTVFPGRSVRLADAAAYGVILIQGRGMVGRVPVETPTCIRYGQMTRDELFVTAPAARAGVLVTNPSDSENLVLLKHFGPGNPDAAPMLEQERRTS